MDTAIDYLCRMVEVLNQAKADFNDYSKKLSLLDKEMQDVLHNIENEVFDAAKGYYFAKQLKDIRNRRRTVKNNHELLQILISSFDCDSFDIVGRKLQRKIQQQSEFIYIPRVLDKAE
jgi:site-specific DNA-cytosine methylase